MVPKVAGDPVAATRMAPKAVARRQFMQKRAKFSGSPTRCLLLILVGAVFATSAIALVLQARTDASFAD